MTADHLDNTVDVLVHVFLEVVEVSLAKSFLDSKCPVNLVNSENYLTRPLTNPLLHVSFLVVDVGLLGKLADCCNHDEFYFFHPLFNVTLLAAFVDIYFFDKRYFFLLSRDHITNLFTFSKTDARNTLK